ncbi:MAG: metallophosphoesterase [Gammaproteobacteria bacterium]|nr:metallophosphoesterase [Gammaproteobacteria bacterium]
MFSGPQVLVLPENTQGRDLYVGDIHGSYTVFKKIVDSLKPEDRLFIVGDLTDRGENSAAVIFTIISINSFRKSQQLPDQIYVTVGNHEELLLGTLLKDPDKTRYFHFNGGGWIDNRNLEQYFNVWRNYLKSLPHVILTEGANPVCMVHTDMPIDFAELERRLQKNPDHTQIFNEDELHYLRWAREKPIDRGTPLIRLPKSHETWDRLTICGHTVFGVESNCNIISKFKPFRENKLHLNLDVGGCYYDSLLVFEPKTLKFEIISKNIANPYAKAYKDKAAAELQAFKKKKENELKSILQNYMIEEHKEIVFNENDTLHQLLTKIRSGKKISDKYVEIESKISKFITYLSNEKYEFQVKIDKLFNLLDQRKNKLIELESKIESGNCASVENIFTKYYKEFREKRKICHEKIWEQFVNHNITAYQAYVSEVKNKKELSLDEKLEQIIQWEETATAKISVFKDKRATEIGSINFNTVFGLSDAVQNMHKILKQQTLSQIESLKKKYISLLTIEPILATIQLPNEDDENYTEKLLGYKKDLGKKLYEAHKNMLIAQCNQNQNLLKQKVKALTGFTVKIKNQHDEINKKCDVVFLTLGETDRQCIDKIEAWKMSADNILPSNDVTSIATYANSVQNFSSLNNEELMTVIDTQNDFLSKADSILLSSNEKYNQLSNPLVYLNNLKNRENKSKYQKYVNDLAGLGGEYIQKRLKFMSQAKQDLIAGFLSSVSSYSQFLQNKNLDEVDCAEKLSELVSLTRNFKTVLVEHYEKDAANCFARFFYQKGYFKGTLVSLLENVLEKYDSKKPQVNASVKPCPDYFTQVHLHR